MINVCITLRNMNEAAIAAKLTQNESRVLQHLINKTLTYCKVSDSQTDYAIAAGTGIRADRAVLAAESLIKKGLFTRTPIKIKTRMGWSDGYRYTIAGELISDKTPDFFGAENPKSSPKSSPKIGDIHTSTNTNKNHTRPAPEAVDVCSSELAKPKNVDSSTYDALRLALAKLPTATAQNVLEVLSCAITDNSIKTTPTRLGFGLIKQAHAGLLDISCLHKPELIKPRVSPESIERASQEAMYANFAKIQGISIEEVKKQMGVRV